MTDEPIPPPTTRRRPVKVEATEAPVRDLIKMGEAALEAAEDIFNPSDAMVRARAVLWDELRDGPKQANELSIPQLVSLTRETRVTGWMRKEGFREWFTNTRENEILIETAYTTLLTGLKKRIPTMADKDAINYLKLIAELANKMPKKWENTRVLDADVGRMSDDQRVALMVDTLRRMGATVVLPTAKLTPGEEKPVDSDLDPMYTEKAGEGVGSDHNTATVAPRNDDPPPPPVD